MNGSFTEGTDGFADWFQLGSPTTGSASPPGGTYANISSTNGGGGSDTVPDISIALDNANLPATDITHLPTVGQAIYQDFTVTTASALSFEYAYSTFDIYPNDSAGYTIDGQYTQLQQTPATQETTPTSYYTVTGIDLAPGEHQIGFVSYNTSDEDASTHIYVTDVELTALPEPGTWSLAALAMLGLAARPVRRLVGQRA